MSAKKFLITYGTTGCYPGLEPEIIAADSVQDALRRAMQDTESWLAAVEEQSGPMQVLYATELDEQGHPIDSTTDAIGVQP